MSPILLSAGGNLENQDRGLVLWDGSRATFCVADGAGGRSGGLEAALMAIHFIRQGAGSLRSAESCAELLRGIDRAMADDTEAGETTCVLLVVTLKEVFGASVGDSGAWLIPHAGGHVDLTSRQQRKPFIGSGSAWPIPFQLSKPEGLLLLATDGLLKYTSADCIVAICREHRAESASARLVELVRYPSGALPDDVTVILTEL